MLRQNFEFSGQFLMHILMQKRVSPHVKNWFSMSGYNLWNWFDIGIISNGFRSLINYSLELDTLRLKFGNDPKTF